MTRLEQMLAFLEQDPNDSFARYAVALEYASARDYSSAVEQLGELRCRLLPAWADPDHAGRVGPGRRGTPFRDRSRPQNR